MTEDDKALVKRLRLGDFYRDDAAYWEVDAGKADALCDQAADLIETQAREIERLRSELEQLEVDAMEHYNDFHEAGCDQKSAIDLAFAVAAYCRAALMGVKP